MNDPHKFKTKLISAIESRLDSEKQDYKKMGKASGS